MPRVQTRQLPEGVSYSPSRAEAVVRFIERATVHTKSSWAKKPFVMQDWQSGDVWKDEESGLWRCDGIVRPAFGAVKWSELHQRWVRNYSLIWLEVARKNGKLLAVGTPILTARGWAKIEEIQPGDVVYAMDGTPTTVQWVSDPHPRPSYRIDLKSGRSIIAGDNHRWTVHDQRASGKLTVQTTQYMFENFTFSSRNDRRWAIPVAEAVQTPDVDLPLDPYVLGLWLGDGATANASVTTMDAEIVDAIEAAGFPHSFVYSKADNKASTYGFLGGLRAKLNTLGVLGNKHVPEIYLNAGTGQRLALLQGLMDTDGCVSLTGLSGATAVEFCNTNEQIARSVYYLAWSLGWKPQWITGRATLYGTDYGEKYRVIWSPTSAVSPFRLDRKKRRLPAEHSTRRSRKDAIVAITPVGTRDGVCIAVDHPSHTYLAGHDLIVTHNSELMAALGLYLLIADGEWSAENYSVAVDRKQASLVFNVARDMIKLSPFLSKMYERGEIIITDSTKHITYVPTLSTYQVVSADADRSLGANPHGVLFDEVLLQPDRHLWDTFEQGFGTRAQSLLIGITTAGHDRESFAYGEHTFGAEVAQDPSKDPSRFVFMASVDENADWQNEETWYDANPGMYHPERNPQGFFNIEQLRKEATRAKNNGDLVALAKFRVFRLNQWGTKIDGWLDLDVWDESEDAVGDFDTDQVTDLVAVGGLDLAEIKDLTSWQLVFEDKETGNHYVLSRHWITRQAMETQHRKRLAQFREWEAEGLLTVFDSEVQDYDSITDTILQDIETYKVRAMGFDPWQSTAIINRIEQRTDVLCIKVPQTTTRMNPGSKELVRLMGKRQIGTGHNPMMRWQAGNAVPKVDGDGNVKPDKRPSLDSIDGLVALVNALAVKVQLPDEPDGLGFYAFDDAEMAWADDE